jgi:hypothetical protein
MNGEVLQGKLYLLELHSVTKKEVYDIEDVLERRTRKVKKTSCQ